MKKMITRAVKSSVAVGAVMSLTGCFMLQSWNIRPTKPEDDPDKPQPEKRLVEKTEIDARASDLASAGIYLDPADIDEFDASYVSADLSDSNLAFTFSSVPVTVKVLDGTSTVASQTFQMNRSGETLTFANSSSVTNWVRSYSDDIDGFEVEAGPFKFDGPTGANTFVVELYYDSQVAAGGSSSEYFSGGPGSGPCCDEEN